MATSMRLSSPSVMSTPAEVVLRDLGDRPVHRLVVVRRGHDEVAHDDAVTLVDLVVVKERAAGRLDEADPLLSSLPRHDEVFALNVGIVEEHGDLLRGVEELDHPGPVVGHREVVRTAVRDGLELTPRRLGLGCVDEIRRVDP